MQDVKHFRKINQIQKYYYCKKAK